ncbi:hypothetical protein EYF80_018332 [Liparis tanakae]|uniref:Uncharacterized protein n=1 Tax=Liparis tanakae TaxID=230148 RepID=A0A4Z2I0S2_9TELE|nr:hypothetical protein EYF80_018332 [Liparis tanakae]
MFRLSALAVALGSRRTSRRIDGGLEAAWATEAAARQRSPRCCAFFFMKGSEVALLCPASGEKSFQKATRRHSRLLQLRCF